MSERKLAALGEAGPAVLDEFRRWLISEKLATQKEVDEAFANLALKDSALLSAIDQAAEVRTRRDAEVTRRLNELFSDPASAADQAGAASALDTAGTEWNDERW